MSTIYWKDFDNEFKKKNDGDVVDMVNIDAIHNSLTNIFETFQGRRRMLPEFALPIYGILFEPVDEITSYRLGEMILQAVERWEPRIQVDNVEVLARPDQNEYRINLEYRIVNDSREEGIQIFTNILRAA
jgi:phage baseplate assembly protein W